jgi:hypothetical protein
LTQGFVTATYLAISVVVYYFVSGNRIERHTMSKGSDQTVRPVPSIARSRLCWSSIEADRVRYRYSWSARVHRHVYTHAGQVP